MRYIAPVVYLAGGLVLWQRNRHSTERQGLVSVVLWTLTLGSLANFVIWVAFNP